MRVTKLIFMQTPAQTKQYIRPYNTNITGETLNALADATNQGQNVVRGALCGISSSIMHPTAQHEGQANIANGWETQRLRFFMEIEEMTDYGGASLVQLVTGFTDHMGVSHGGAVDPNMRMYFNNSISLRTMRVNMGNGVEETSRVTQSSQFLLGDKGVGFHGMNQVSLRPADIFSVQSSGALSGDSQVIDCRTGFQQGPQRSNRSNTYVPDYLTNVVGAYKMAASHNSFNQVDSELSAAALGYVKDPSVNDGFFGRLRRESGYVENSSITYAELCFLSPGLDNLAQIITLGSQACTTAAPGTINYSTQSTCGWNGANYETVEAANLVQAIPAMMMELMISEINVASTNDTINGLPITTVQGYGSFTNKVKMTPYIQMFIDRFNAEIMRELTRQGLRKIRLNFNMDLTGESFIRLQIDDGIPYDFVSPSFCDGVFSPLITNQSATLQRMAHDFNQVFNGLETDHTPRVVSPAGNPLSGIFYNESTL